MTVFLGGVKAILAIGIILAALAACSEAKTDNAFYNQLVGIMDELNEQWGALDAPGTRGMNVSRNVCVVATLSRLQTLNDDPSVAGNVTYKFYEKSLTYADNSQNWTITRPLGWTEKQVLMISISPRDGCVAIYRHMN